MRKEKKAEWKLKEQDFRNQINKDLTKQHRLEEKIKDLELHLKTNRTSSTSQERNKNSKHFTNKIETKAPNGKMILLKDESCKGNKNKKVKYHIKGVPGGSVKARDERDDAFISFSELSTKEPDRSKPSSIKKKLNPYKIEYLNNPNDVSDSMK